jgi:hypothetical protein
MLPLFVAYHAAFCNRFTRGKISVLLSRSAGAGCDGLGIRRTDLGAEMLPTGQDRDMCHVGPEWEL